MKDQGKQDKTLRILAFYYPVICGLYDPATIS